MKLLAHRVLKLVADGDFHSGEAMARALGVSRASVWHAMREIRATGLEVYRVRGRGYRLAQALSLLDPAAIACALSARSGRIALEVVDSIESTNSALMQRAQQGAQGPAVIAAEWQRAGRGRQGRAWLSGVGGALTFSVLWRFRCGANDLAGLSLAVGAAIGRALELLGAAEIGLKWPNDIVWRGQKLAGILIEMHGDILGPTAAVIGIGVNVRLGAHVRRAIDQPATDLETASGAAVDRNQALACLLNELIPGLEVFAREGFAPFRAEWIARHVHQDRPVTVLLPDSRRERGVARGVAEDGALLVETLRGTRRFHSGEVSVRSSAGERMGA
jgi:BirA family transcriptional regulator, biotin operon repressor / biotin---[acetyl-CoA-carboxylase] ligase